MKATLVLEIGSSWLKMAVLGSAISSQYVKAVSVKKTTNLAEDAVAQFISDFLKELKIKKPQTIIISFSRNAVTLRNLRIPSSNPSEINDMIKLHVGRQVPYAKEEIVDGFRVIGKDSMGYAKVMLAIVHREGIRKVFRILEKVGLYTDRLELSSDGVFAALSGAIKADHFKSDEPFIILDVDSNFTDFMIATNENVLFSRVITQGASHLRDQARWPKFIGEIKQTMVISQGEEVVQNPFKKIYVSGVVSVFGGLASMIEKEFNLSVGIIEPFSHLSVAKEVIKDPSDVLARGSFSSLLGLGFDLNKTKICFVLPEVQIRKMLKEKVREIIFLGSMTMYLILIVCGVYFEKTHNRKTYLAIIQERYKRISVDAEGLDEKMRRLKQVDKKIDTKSAAINYLLEVVKLLPTKITVKTFSYEKDDKLILKGIAEEMSDVFSFITTLEQSVYFKEVQTRYATRKVIKNQTVNEFELICPIEGVKIKDKKGAKKEKDEN